MVKRIVVGAHYGIKDWIIQRVTAVVMAIYTVVLALAILSLDEYTQASWQGLFSEGYLGLYMRYVTFLFILSVIYHTWIGIRDIWMDYIKPTGVRLVFHALTALALVGYAGWAVRILWRL